MSGPKVRYAMGRYAVNVIRAVAVAVLVVLILVGCRTTPKVSSEPAVTKLSGPSSGFPGDTLSFKVTGVDPDGRDLSYEMDWGDTSGPVWTTTHPSGNEVTLQHVYSDTGTFAVRAKARTSSENESKWSDTVLVQVVEVWLPAPAVVCEAISEGLALQLTWTAVVHADSYRVTFDTTVLTTPCTGMSWFAPARLISVRALRGSTKGEPAYVDCTPVMTTFTVYSRSDSTQPCAFGFSLDGTCTTYLPLSWNYSLIDFVVDDINMLPIGLVNGGDHGWPGNMDANTLVGAGTSDFDAFEYAGLTGFSTRLEIVSGQVYAFWLSTSVFWSTADHFCKAKVISIEQTANGQKVAMKVVYQKVGGLRWLKTN